SCDHWLLHSFPTRRSSDLSIILSIFSLRFSSDFALFTPSTYSRWQLGLNLSQAFFNSLLSCKVFAKLSGTFTPFFVSIRSDICFFTMTANGPAALRSFDRALLEVEILQNRLMYEVRAATECIRR